MSNNMIVFPMGPVLVGAAFPLTGLPDLPGAGKVDPAKQQQRQQPQQQSQPQPPPQLGPFAPEMLTRLRDLDPQQRELFMQRLIQQRQIRQQQQRQQQQQQQTGAPPQEAPAPGVGMHNMSPFMNAANLPMNMFGVQGPNGGGGGVPQRQAGGGVRPGGGPGTVNYEMMQSFIQRSDGSSRQ
jgi:mediator of RNA polymerase II transcription subunit 25